MTELVLTFDTTQHAIAAEAALLAGGLAVHVMPLPSDIRAGCGLCLGIPPETYAQATALLARAGIPTGGAYTRAVQGGKSHYQPYEGGETTNAP